jgi:excisionase family DNA binding protein
MPPKKTHFTIAEAAARLGISRAAVHEAVRTGRLEAKRGQVMRTIWLIPARALRSYKPSSSHQQRGKKRK